MAKNPKQNNHTRKAAMERTRAGVFSTAKGVQRQPKLQDKLLRQDRKMAERLERQQREVKSVSSVDPIPTKKNAASKPKKGPSFPNISLPARKPKRDTTSSGSFQMILGGKSKRLVKPFTIVGILLAIILLIHSLAPLGLWEYTKNIIAGTGTGDGFPVAISTSHRNRITAVGSDIALLTDSSLQLYKSNGKLLFDRQHGFSSPAVTAASARVMVYDRGSKGLKIENRANTVLSMEAKGNITAATMTDNGHFALVTRSADYLADATVYNKKGKERFTWHSSARHIVGVALSESGRYMAITTLQVEAGEAKTDLLLFDTRKGTTLLEETVKGAYPLSVDIKGTTAVAILSDRVMSVTKTGKKAEYCFDGGTLTCFENRQDYGTALTLGMYQDAQNNRLVVLNKKMEPIGVRDLTAEPMALSGKGSTVAILTDGQVLYFNRKGTERGTAPLQSDASTLLCKGARVIVLGSDRLDEVHK